MTHRIGVISDTHGLLRPEIKEILRGCEIILHGGDINKQSILDELADIAPVHVVKGNADKEWAEHIPGILSLELYGFKVLMIHNRKQLPEHVEDADIIIYGHSHKYEEKYLAHQLWLNPGSCGPRRFTLPITMAVLEIGEDRSVRVQKQEIPHKDPDHVKAQKGSIPADAGQEKVIPGIKGQNGGIPENIRQIIEDTIRDINRGKSVKEIARKNRLSEGLAEQICRLYLTHPGVDADGIMTKMGL